MSEEEKKSIELAKVLIGLEEYNKLSYIENKAIQTILNLIDRLQKDLNKKDKEIEKHKKIAQELVNENCKLKNEIYPELVKQDEVINRMVEVIEECRQNGCIEFNEEIDLSDIAGEEMVKEYFYKKAEEEK